MNSQYIVDKFREVVCYERKYERVHILKDTKDKAQVCAVKLSARFRMCFFTAYFKGNMILFKAENSEMENYLRVIEEYLKSNLCKDMTLSKINNIKTVDRSKLPRNVDARSEGDTIFLSIQSIKQAMESVSLFELPAQLKKDVREMQCNVVNILNNLYHEFCHINERALLPILHNIIADEKHYTILEKLVAHFWIEFVVECKSGEQHFRSEIEFWIHS